MKIDIKQYSLDPQAFLDAIHEEYQSASSIPMQSKAPLELLGQLISATYKIKTTKPSMLNAGSCDQFLADTEKRLQKDGMEIDDPIPYLIHAAIYYKTFPKEFGVASSIYTAVEDVNKFKLVEKNIDDLISRIPYEKNDAFYEMAKPILASISKTKAPAKGIGFFKAEDEAKRDVISEIDDQISVTANRIVFF